MGVFYWILFLIPLAYAGIFKIGTKQSVAVTGRLMCDKKPAADVKLKLYEVDPGLDDLMAEGKTDSNGTFYLQGTETEYSTIDPKLNIYHNCNDERHECLRKVEIKIDKKFVKEGETPGEPFDIGVLNLFGKLPGESRDCIN